MNNQTITNVRNSEGIEEGGANASNEEAEKYDGHPVKIPDRFAIVVCVQLVSCCAKLLLPRYVPASVV